VHPLGVRQELATVGRDGCAEVIRNGFMHAQSGKASKRGSKIYSKLALIHVGDSLFLMLMEGVRLSRECMF
jgi:hypothetical protein